MSIVTLINAGGDAHLITLIGPGGLGGGTGPGQPGDPGYSIRYADVDAAGGTVVVTLADLRPDAHVRAGDLLATRDGWLAQLDTWDEPAGSGTATARFKMTGTDGNDGTDGTDGTDGKDGLDGYSMRYAAISPAGAASAAVALAQLAPSTNVRAGDTLVTTDGYLYRLTAWSDAAASGTATLIRSLNGAAGAIGYSVRRANVNGAGAATVPVALAQLSPNTNVRQSDLVITQDGFYGQITSWSGTTSTGTITVIHDLNGAPGAGGGAAFYYEHVQAAAATTWTINHNLAARPNVALLTTGGVQMLAEVVHLNTNQAQALFDVAVAGRAICS
jgi:hypothetical protein